MALLWAADIHHSFKYEVVLPGGLSGRGSLGRNRYIFNCFSAKLCKLIPSSFSSRFLTLVFLSCKSTFASWPPSTTCVCGDTFTELLGVG